MGNSFFFWNLCCNFLLKYMGGGVGVGGVGVFMGLMGDSFLDLWNSLGESVGVCWLMIFLFGNGGLYIVYVFGEVYKIFLGMLYIGLGMLYVLLK